MASVGFEIFEKQPKLIKFITFWYFAAKEKEKGKGLVYLDFI